MYVILYVCICDSFEIDYEEAKAQLPADAPQSLVILAQQCIEYDSNMRPIGQEVVDWLQDLLANYPADTVPLPPMRDCPPGFDNSSTTNASVTSSKLSEYSPTISKANSSSKISTPTQLFKNPLTQSTNSIGTPLTPTTDPGTGAMERVRRVGVLHKRNATGFRNWKKVEFTLYTTRLS